MMLRMVAEWSIPLLLLFVPLLGLIKGLPVYQLFVSGAEEGLRLALHILPALLSITVAVSVFRAGGAFAVLECLLRPLTKILGIPAELLPLFLLRPISGSGALAVTADIITQCGADSRAGIMASVVQGSTETTFYVLSVYFGSVGVRDHRYAPAVGLLADIISMTTACLVADRLLF